MAEGEIVAPNSGGEGTTPEHEPPAAPELRLLNHAATPGEVLKMQTQIAELEAQLAEKESKVTDDL